MPLREVSRILKCLLRANCVDVTVEDLNYDLRKVSSNKLLYHMIGHTQVLN